MPRREAWQAQVKTPWPSETPQWRLGVRPPRPISNAFGKLKTDLLFLLESPSISALILFCIWTIFVFFLKAEEDEEDTVQVTKGGACQVERIRPREVLRLPLGIQPHMGCWVPSCKPPSQTGLIKQPSLSPPCKIVATPCTALTVPLALLKFPLHQLHHRTFIYLLNSSISLC